MTCFVGAGRFLRQPQGVAADVGQRLDFIALVVVGQDQGVALERQAADFLNEFAVGHALPVLVGRKAWILW